MQPETRSLPQRAAHRPQSRDTPHVLLNQAGREPQPAVRPFSANSHAPTKITDTHTLIISSESFPLKTVGMHVVTEAERFLTHWNIRMLIWILTQIDRKKQKYFNHFLKVISSIPDVFPPTPTMNSLINHTAPPTTTIHSELCKDNMRLEAGSSHTSQNILCLVTTTWARVRAEICPRTECYVIISTSNSILLLSNREVLMVHPFEGTVPLFVHIQTDKNAWHAS